jgi:UDP-4-amino-4,6-dideoxy-L-N-acetyl-beta-L-altrosamine transaminase
MSDQELHARSSVALRVADYVDDMLANPTAFRGQQLRGTGPVAEFESALAERCGFPHCLSTCNATTALLVVALAAELSGKKMIVPPHSWPGSIGPFKFAGVQLQRAQADSHGNISPKSVKSLLNSKTAGVLAVDWKGKRHQVKAIRRICEDAGCLYIEDASWIPGVSGSLKQPSLADIQIISFGPGKPMSLGEGGAILLRSRTLYTQAIAISQHPERSLAENGDTLFTVSCINARIHPVAAILGIELLARGSLQK